MHNSLRAATAGMLIATLAWSPLLRAENLNREVERMFESAGVVSNYTEPGAFRGQAMNGYTGGSLMARVPVKRLRLINLELPSMRGSCNGIDMFGGSFSMISADQLKEMLKKFVASLPGIGFQLAVEAVSPLFAKQIAFFKDLESKFTLGQQNTCALATSLVSTVMEKNNMSTEKACRALATLQGDANDIAEAQQRCSDAATRGNILNTARASTERAQQDETPFAGNMVWEALKHTGSDIDDNERQLIMSLVGTVVYADGKPASYYAPSVTNLRDLLYGERANADGQVTVSILKCDTLERCEHMATAEETFTSFSTHTKKMLKSIADHIANREGFTALQPEVAFIDTVTEPVYRMIAVASSGPDLSPVYEMIGTYGDVIAADYAHTFLDRNLRLGMTALQKNYRLDATQVDDADRIIRNAHEARKLLAAEKVALNQKVQGVETLTTRLERMERHMRNLSPAHVISLLGRGANSQ